MEECHRNTKHRHTNNNALVLGRGDLAVGGGEVATGGLGGWSAGGGSGGLDLDAFGGHGERAERDLWMVDVLSRY